MARNGSGTIENRIEAVFSYSRGNDRSRVDKPGNDGGLHIGKYSPQRKDAHAYNGSAPACFLHELWLLLLATLSYSIAFLWKVFALATYLSGFCNKASSYLCRFLQLLLQRVSIRHLFRCILENGCSLLAQPMSPSGNCLAHSYHRCQFDQSSGEGLALTPYLPQTHQKNCANSHKLKSHDRRNSYNHQHLESHNGLSCLPMFYKEDVSFCLS